MTPGRILPDPVTEPTISVPRAAAVLGIGVRSAYAAVEHGQWPSIRIGRRIVIPSDKWLRALGLDHQSAELRPTR